MPDPSISEALLESYALAPANDDVILHTVEIRHPAFVDSEGNPDSIWVVADNRDWVLTIEEGAEIKGGQSVNHQKMAFNFTLPPIQPGATPEIEVSLDGVSRIIAEQLDLAVADGSPIVMVYRPFLASDTSEPQMDPPPSFELGDVQVGVMTVRARARTGVDLRVAFPRRLYTTTEFPGLIGR
jgi:hypothetical protein